MNDFQIPLFQALIVTLLLSTLLNYLILKYSKNINIKKRNQDEKRLSTQHIPPFGGIACSLAFLISTRSDVALEQSYLPIIALLGEKAQPGGGAIKSGGRPSIV